jgi:hypothetical protein
MDQIGCQLLIRKSVNFSSINAKDKEKKKKRKEDQRSIERQYTYYGEEVTEIFCTEFFQTLLVALWVRQAGGEVQSWEVKNAR